MTGTVRHAEFLGASTRAVVHLEDGADVVALLTGARPRAGDRVVVTLTSPAHRVP